MAIDMNDGPSDERIAPRRQGEIGPEIGPKILALLTAAASCFLGRTVRIRSVKVLGAEPSIRPNPWGRSGRVANGQAPRRDGTGGRF